MFSPIKRHPKVPGPLMVYLRGLPKLTDDQFRKVFGHVLSIVLSEEPIEIPVSEMDKKLANEIKVSKDVIATAGRSLTPLFDLFMEESDVEEFQQHLLSIGISKERSEYLWKELSSKKDAIQGLLSDVLATGFMTRVSGINWRVDTVNKSNGQYDISDPLGLIHLSLEGKEESFDETLEVDVDLLNYLIEELVKMRKEMDKLITGSREKDKK